MEQRIELKPNCSLKPAGAMLFFVATCLFSLGFALFFVVQGFWPVLPFWAVEMLALGLALNASMRSGEILANSADYGVANQPRDPFAAGCAKTGVCAALGEG